MVSDGKSALLKRLLFFSRKLKTQIENVTTMHSVDVQIFPAEKKRKSEDNQSHTDPSCEDKPNSIFSYLTVSGSRGKVKRSPECCVDPHFVPIYQTDVKLFHRIRGTFALLVVQEKKSDDDQQH